MRKERPVPRYFLLPPIDATVDGTAARVVDMGTKGARVELRAAINPGVMVDILMDSIRVRGMVLWCQVDAMNFSTDHDGYLAGIAFSQHSTAVDELLTDLSIHGCAIRIEEM